jgi:hypothetical protein
MPEDKPRTLAEQIFEHDGNLYRLEDDLFDLLDAVGFGDSWSDWGRDYYDSSLELYGVPVEERLTEDGVKRLLGAGFSIIFVNHSDGTETHYTKANPVGWRTEVRSRARPEEPTEMKRLRRRIAELEKR